MKVGIDVMGGDFAPKACIGGAILAHKEMSPADRIVLIGDQDIIRNSLLAENANPQDFDIVHAPDVIGMGEHPTKALLKKPHSSIGVGFNLLKNHKIDAFSGAGSSGAMLVGAIFSVNAIPGIIRPCTSGFIPQEDGGVSVLLDIGTNPDVKPDVLYQFAILGSLYADYVHKIKNPRVGLLNIGGEEEKGNLACQAAYKLMKNSKNFNFVGNVEGRDLYKGKADVIVCDGFTGNIVLKQAEAMYRMMLKRGLIDDYFRRFNYENYGGTPLLGINASVILGHGISNDVANKNMILLARDVFNAKLPQRIKNAINDYAITNEV